MKTFVLDAPPFATVLNAACTHAPICLKGHTENGEVVSLRAKVYEEKSGDEVAFIIKPTRGERRFRSGYFPFGDRFCLN